MPQFAKYTKRRQFLDRIPYIHNIICISNIIKLIANRARATPSTYICYIYVT